MLCECCHKRLANVHYIKLVNNRQEEMHLCEQCAREKKQETAGSGFDLSDFFSGMIGYEVPSKDMGNVYRTVECPGCGMTDREFEKTGKAGCAACYGTFHKRMDTIIKRLHGSVRHSN